MLFGDSVKIGHLSYKIEETSGGLIARERYGECINYPVPIIRLDIVNNPDPLETYFHEIAEAVQGALIGKTVIDEDFHVTFINLFYMALRENRLLNQELIDKVDGLKNE